MVWNILLDTIPYLQVTKDSKNPVPNALRDFGQSAYNSLLGCPVKGHCDDAGKAIQVRPDREKAIKLVSWE